MGVFCWSCVCNSDGILNVLLVLLTLWGIGSEGLCILALWCKKITGYFINLGFMLSFKCFGSISLIGDFVYLSYFLWVFVYQEKQIQLCELRLFSNFSMW